MTDLQQIADYFAEIGNHRWAETILEAVKALENHSKALQIYQRERDRFLHSNPEFTGAYFLTGGLGYKDSNGLPEYVTICPAYGCAWEQVYQRTERTISHEGS